MKLKEAREMAFKEEVAIIIKNGAVQDVYGTSMDIGITVIDLDQTDPENLKVVESEANCVRNEMYHIR